jgi:hypothetical protein
LRASSSVILLCPGSGLNGSGGGFGIRLTVGFLIPNFFSKDFLGTGGGAMILGGGCAIPVSLAMKDDISPPLLYPLGKKRGVTFS